jgi:hypothetical protein
MDSNPSLFFQIAAGLIPALIFGGVLSNGLKPKDRATVLRPFGGISPWHLISGHRPSNLPAVGSRASSGGRRVGDYHHLEHMDCRYGACGDYIRPRANRGEALAPAQFLPNRPCADHPWLSGAYWRNDWRTE